MISLFQPFTRAHARRATPESASSHFEIIDSTGDDGGNIISTSLYANLEEPTRESLQSHESRKGSWWGDYFQPLKESLRDIPHGWQARVYLCESLGFLLDELRDAGASVILMNRHTGNTLPGMLWRYLPLDNDTVNHVFFRGADSFTPSPLQFSLHERQRKSSLPFLRSWYPRDLDKTGTILRYRPMPGPFAVADLQSLPILDFAYHADAWITACQRSPIPHARLDGLSLPKVGASSWDAFGMDEQFLSHWLYHIAVREGMISHVRGSKSLIYTAHDRAYTTAWNPDNVFLP